MRKSTEFRKQTNKSAKIKKKIDVKFQEIDGLFLDDLPLSTDTICVEFNPNYSDANAGKLIVRKWSEVPSNLRKVFVNRPEEIEVRETAPFGRVLGISEEWISWSKREGVVINFLSKKRGREDIEAITRLENLRSVSRDLSLAWTMSLLHP